jgi:hypothetical protein
LNPISAQKVMIKIHRCTHSIFFQKIKDFPDFSFLKFIIDLELDLSKSGFANLNILAEFVLILEFDGF